MTIGTRTARSLIDNLLKSTVAAATHELMADGVDWCLSVFVDNAGVIAFDDEHAVCFKVGDAQPSVGDRAVRRRGDGDRRLHSRHHRHRPRREADRGDGRLLRCAPRSLHPSTPMPTDGETLKRLPAGCLHPAPHPAAGRRRRARLRQPDGHSHAQRRGVVRRRLRRQPARLLRLRRGDAARCACTAIRRSVTGSSPSAAAPDATASTARRSVPPS